MAELESVIEKRLIDQLCSGESQWTYRPDLRTEEDLWKNFKYILEQNNKAKLDGNPLSESEFAKIKNDLSHASFYDAGKWMVGENGKVYGGDENKNTNVKFDDVAGLDEEKQEMKRNKVPDELIEQANTFYETEDQEILNAREQFKKLVNEL